MPATFRLAVETAWSTVALLSLADGTEYSEALSVAFSEPIGRYVIYVDTGQLAISEYLLVIPLRNGETVELTISVEPAV